MCIVCDFGSPCLISVYVLIGLIIEDHCWLHLIPCSFVPSPLALVLSSTCLITVLIWDPYVEALRRRLSMLDSRLLGRQSGW